MAMRHRDQNYIIIKLKPGLCRLEILNDLKEWELVYWGEKEEVKVKDLAPNTCYFFRMKCNGEDWIEFRGATSDELFLTMHLTRAIQSSKTAVIRKIAHQRFALLEVENKQMKTPLRQAIEKNDLNLVNLLINLGANVNTASFYSKRTPLMTAIMLGFLSIANFLIDKGAKINDVDINGLNILHHAVDSNKLDSVKFALKHLPVVDCQDCNGWTPLIRAAILNCDVQIVDFLRENGASTSVTDKNGFDFNKHRKLAAKLI